MTRELTDKQAAVLALIDAGQVAGRPPGVEEMKLALGTRHNNTVAGFLRALERKKFIFRVHKRARAVTILRRRDGDRVLWRGEWFVWVPAAELAAPAAQQEAA